MTTESPLGDISRRGVRTTLRYSRMLGHAPDEVWRALTESEHLRWWMPVDMIGARTPGGTVELVFWPDLAEKHGLDRAAGTGTIRVWDPPRTFEWTWHDSIVRFDVRSVAAGTELILTVDIGSDDPETIIDNAGGYHLWMDHLTTLLDRGAGTPIAAADPGPVEARYRALPAGR